MIVTYPLVKRAFVGVLAMTLTAPLLADTLMTLDRNGAGTLPVEYRDADNLRIGSEDRSSWYLTSEGADFVIMKSPNGKKRFAMNMDEFLAREDAPAPVEADLDTLSATRTGRQEIVNGVAGHVYLVDGGHRSWELVLTDDATIATVTEAVYGAEIRMAQMSGQGVSAQPLVSELALARSLGVPGILRGQLYTLADMRDGGAQPDDHYQLASDTLIIKDWKEMQDAYH